MSGFEGEAFRAQALSEQPAQLDIIIDDEHAIHSRSPTFDTSASALSVIGVYKTLYLFTNLYRTGFVPMLELTGSKEMLV
jgi:hypothetical protein